MNSQLITATSQGIQVLSGQASGWQVTSHSLRDLEVTCVTAHGSRITAGTTEGIYLSDDLGQTWREANEGLALRHIRWLAAHADDRQFILAGTEPAGIFRSTTGDSWQPCPEVFELRDRHGWFLPYSPEAGCVRGFSFHGERAYAAVEVGGVLVSTDRGKTWNLAQGSSGDPASAPAGFIHSDVHSILVHPSDPNLVFAPTGGGFYRSTDGGKTWELLYRCYCRAVWVDPSDPERIVLGPADSVDRGGRIEMSPDGGKTWQPASSGLDVPWAHHMVERFYQTGNELMAVLSNGALVAAGLPDLTWKPVLTAPKRVNALATARS